MGNWYSHEAQERREAQDRPQRPPAVLPACAPGLWVKMQYYLEGRGLNFRLAERNGWYPSNSAGDEESRIVMPGTRGDEGVFWQARTMLPNAAKRYQSPRADRADALILVKPDGKSPTRAALVEGPMDALAAAEIGLLGIAIMGNTPNMVVLDHIARLIQTCAVAYVIPDSDALFSAARLTTWIRTHTKTASQLWYPYPYKDLAAVPLEKRKEQFGL